MNEAHRPKPGFERGRGPAGSTSDAATDTGVSDEHPPRPPRVGHEDGAHPPDPQTSPPDVRDTWNAERTNAGPEAMRGEERRPEPTAGDPFADVDRDDIAADRTGYRERSGI